MELIKLSKKESSLIKEIEYHEDKKVLIVRFHSYYVNELAYRGVPLNAFLDFSTSNSYGKFYLQYIKTIFSTKNPEIMADKIIKCKINVSLLREHPEWLFEGEKGTYLNFTILFNEKQDGYGNNGMIIQDVPTEVYKKDKTIKGPILGNCKVFGNGGLATTETKVGSFEGKPLENMDDLPF